MTAFTDSITTVAASLLTEFGESASFVRVAEGAYDTATGTLAAGTTTNYTGFVVPVDYMSREIDDVHVLQGDVKLFVEKTTSEPLVGDEVTIGGTEYKVMRAKRVRVSGVNVMYELQVRR